MDSSSQDKIIRLQDNTIQIVAVKDGKKIFHRFVKLEDNDPDMHKAQGSMLAEHLRGLQAMLELT